MTKPTSLLWRYILAKQGERYFLFSQTSAAILMALNENTELTYEELKVLVDCPKASLYVFCQRLEKAELIHRQTHKGTDSNNRPNHYTTVSLVGEPVTFPEINLVR